MKVLKNQQKTQNSDVQKINSNKKYQTLTS